MPLPLAVRVYLEDTDAGGVVYHASYVRYLERARTEALRMAGLEQSRNFEHDQSFVVAKLEVQFHAPARLDALLWVTCSLTEHTGARLIFRQRVEDQLNGRVYCSADVQVACISLARGRPRRIDAALVETLLAVCAPDTNPADLSPAAPSPADTNARTEA